MISTDARLARVETKIDIALGQLAELRAHEKRLSALERWRAFLLGAAAVLGAAFGWITGHK
jgi:hypothetical protein